MRFMYAALTRAVEARHPWTRGHAERVADLALPVARVLGWNEPDVARLHVGCLLHDVGKLSLDPVLLGRPGPLNANERAIVRTHPAAGAALVELAGAHAALPCVLWHHEHWDGAGYPHRLAGARIPIEARLIAIADAFDAMTSPRPYRSQLTVRAALDELVHCAGTQFDPMLADACVEIWDEARVHGRAAAGC